MSSWETEVAAKTMVYKDHQSRFCTLLMSAQLADLGATAGITVEDANKSDCMKFLARLIVDSPLVIELPAEPFRFLRSTIEKRRAACDWFLTRAPEDEVTRNHLDFIGVLEWVERHLVSKSKSTLVPAPATSLSRRQGLPTEVALNGKNGFDTLKVYQLSSNDTGFLLAPGLRIEVVRDPPSGSPRGSATLSGKTRYRALFVDHSAPLIDHPPEAFDLGVPFPRTYAAERLSPSYWDSASLESEHIPRKPWPNRQFLTSRTGWLCPIYTTDRWTPPNATDYVAAMYTADTLDAELTSHNISDSGYAEMDTCSFERMDLYRSREYKEYKATRSAAEGLDFIWADDDSITSYYVGDDASVSPAFQLPSRLLLRDFAHTDGPALRGWPEDLSGMNEERLRGEKSDYEATWAQ
ncbi:hypothetical protein B0A48_09341 [Cryoendolithus antarcticus]|uniref:DUF6604 domain-containing protein n=1 Tax=Cryoendolithus antarcticus TaxID=1507870 RepID=A0A1V8T2S9_9PEZI|nr:hypothetical protein B0A48_09341 [Cryoendolithus antarcticus]